MMQNNNDEDFLVDASGHRHQPHSGPARIVSLVPSLTELVCDLGLAGQLVGRTGFCIHPRAILKTIPKVGGTKDVNLARLRELAPTHVIVNVDENRRECVEEIAACVPHVIVTHPCTPEDNLPVYRLLGGIFGREAEAERLCADLAAALDDARAVGASLPAEKVLYLIWRQPWMTVARSTYISAMLGAVGWQTVPEADEPRHDRLVGPDRDVDVEGTAHRRSDDARSERSIAAAGDGQPGVVVGGRANRQPQRQPEQVPRLV